MVYYITLSTVLLLFLHVFVAPTVGALSDLDDWVDQVFDPIMQDGSVGSLTDAKSVHRSLKGNGSEFSVSFELL